MPIGTVKIFNAYMRCGIIISDDEGKDVFVHKDEIQTEDKILKEGQKVLFEIEDGSKGLCAVNVKVI